MKNRFFAKFPFVLLLLSVGSLGRPSPEKWVYPSPDQCRNIMEALARLGATSVDGSYLISDLFCGAKVATEVAACTFKDGRWEGLTRSTPPSSAGWRLMEELRLAGIFARSSGTDPNRVEIAIEEFRGGATPLPDQSPYVPPVMQYACTVTR